MTTTYSAGGSFSVSSELNIDILVPGFASEEAAAAAARHLAIVDGGRRVSWPGGGMEITDAMVRGHRLKPESMARLGPALDVSSEAGRQTAVSALLEGDPAYMTTLVDYAPAPVTAAELVDLVVNHGKPSSLAWFIEESGQFPAVPDALPGVPRPH